MGGQLPTAEGFYWGKWRIADDGTYAHQPGVSKDEQDRPPSHEWEVMHVVENCIDRTDPEFLMVMVPGVSKWQSLENFVWGARVEGPEK
jgi:hypothetical protein